MSTPLRSAVRVIPRSSKRRRARSSRLEGLRRVTWTRISPELLFSASAIAPTIRSESSFEKKWRMSYQLPQEPPPPKHPPPAPAPAPSPAPAPAPPSAAAVGPPPGEAQQRDEEEEQQEEKRRDAPGERASAPAGAGANGGAGAAVFPLRRGDHGGHAGFDTARVVARPEARQDFLLLDPVCHRVRQNAFEAIAALDPHLAVVHEDEEDGTVVPPLLSGGPFSGDRHREFLHCKVFGNVPVHPDQDLVGCLFLELFEAGVERLGPSSRQDTRPVRDVTRRPGRKGVFLRRARRRSDEHEERRRYEGPDERPRREDPASHRRFPFTVSRFPASLRGCRRRCRRPEVELHRRGPFGSGRRLEVGLLLEPEHPRDQVGRESEPRRVVVLGRLVVIHTGDRDAVLRPLQLRLEVPEVGICLELRVLLDDHEQALQRPAESRLSLLVLRQLRRVGRGRSRRDLRPSDGGPRLRHGFERGLLELRGSLDSRDEVGHEVVAPLVLVLDLGPLLVDLLTERDQLVVSPRERDPHDHDDNDKDHETPQTDLPHSAPSLRWSRDSTGGRGRSAAGENRLFFLPPCRCHPEINSASTRSWGRSEAGGWETSIARATTACGERSP